MERLPPVDAFGHAAPWMKLSVNFFKKPKKGVRGPQGRKQVVCQVVRSMIKWMGTPDSHHPQQKNFTDRLILGRESGPTVFSENRIMELVQPLKKNDKTGRVSTV